MGPLNFGKHPEKTDRDRGQYSERKRKRTKKKDQKAGSPELDGVEKSEKGKDRNGNGRQIGLSGRRTRTHTQDHNALSNGTNVRVPRIRGARTAATMGPTMGAHDGHAPSALEEDWVGRVGRGGGKEAGQKASTPLFFLFAQRLQARLLVLCLTWAASRCYKIYTKEAALSLAPWRR